MKVIVILFSFGVVFCGIALAISGIPPLIKGILFGLSAVSCIICGLVKIRMKFKKRSSKKDIKDEIIKETEQAQKEKRKVAHNEGEIDEPQDNEIKQESENLQHEVKEALLNQNKKQNVSETIQFEEPLVTETTTPELKYETPISQEKEKKELTEFQKKILNANQVHHNKQLAFAPIKQTEGCPMTLNQKMTALYESQKKDSDKTKEQKEIKKLKTNDFHKRLNTLVGQQMKMKTSLSQDVILGSKNVLLKKQGSILEPEQHKDANPRNETQVQTTVLGLGVRRNNRRRNVRSPSSDLLLQYMKK